MTDPNPHRRTGVTMLWIAWLLVMGGGWWLADGWLKRQENPNQQVAQRSDGAVVLQRNRQGHYVADGEINGRRVTFLLDTGATNVALSERLARNLDLPRGAAIRLETANGTAYGFATRLQSVRLGDIVVREVNAVFSNGMQDDTVLLGMSFLRHLEFTQRGNELILRTLR